MKLENVRDHENLLLDISKEFFIEWRKYWNYINLYNYKDLHQYYNKKFFKNTEDNFYILIDNYNNIIGYGCIIYDEFPTIKSPKNSIFITDIYIKPNYRRMGNSKLLIELLIIEAKKYEKDILIAVEKKTTFLHNFYKNFGFEFIEEIDYSDKYLIYKLNTSI